MTPPVAHADRGGHVDDFWADLLLPLRFYRYTRKVWTTSRRYDERGVIRVWAESQKGQKKVRLYVVDPDGFHRSFFATPKRLPVLLRQLGF